MKHVCIFLFCISMMTGCSQIHDIITPARHESLVGEPMLNSGQAPLNFVSINDLFPAELPNVGKVKNNTEFPSQFIYGSLFGLAVGYYGGYYAHRHRHGYHHYRRHYPYRRRYWY